MYTKYEIKTYPENQSNIEQKKNYYQNQSKNSESSENSDKDTDPIIETTFQPKCIFTKQNNNISFYQSSSKNSFKNLKSRCNNNKTQIVTPIMKNKNKVYTIKKINERNEVNTIQNFSYNYSDIIDIKNRNNKTIKNNINNINININPKTNNFNFNNNEQPKQIHLKEKIIQRDKRNRRTNSYKMQFNVQKRDDFNVLSYKQPDEDIENIISKNKNKIIKLYKKQEVNEIFFPSKRTHSPSIYNKKTEEVEKYQARTLKYQSFFGTFNCDKKEQIKKSFSRKKINQLNDFNIDKLIEIGDKYANKHQPVLPLGKILNNNIIFFQNKIKKNKFQVPINTYNNCFNYSKYSKKSYNPNYEEDKENIPNLFDDKNRVTKKLISKNNLRNSNRSKDKEFDDVENKKITTDNNTVRKYLNFKNENLNENQNLKINELINNTQNNSSVIIRRRNIKNDTGLRKQNSFNKKMKDNALEEEIPKMKYQKITGNLRINTNNINSNSNSNCIILNKNEKSKEKSIYKKNEKLLTDEANYYRINSRRRVNQNNNRQILIDTNINKGNNRYKNNQTTQNKTKNYYGYDDRHNLEDTINNHAYYESSHYKKA